jgi:hypothetical protein
MTSTTSHDTYSRDARLAAADGRPVFVGLLSPAGVLLDGFPRQTGADGGPDDGSRLWETPWWAWSPDVQQRLRSAVARAVMGELVRYDDTVRLAGNMLVTVDLTVSPVVTTSGITAVRCLMTDPRDG